MANEDPKRYEWLLSFPMDDMQDNSSDITQKKRPKLIQHSRHRMHQIALSSVKGLCHRLRDSERVSPGHLRVAFRPAATAAAQCKEEK